MIIITLSFLKAPSSKCFTAHLLAYQSLRLEEHLTKASGPPAWSVDEAFCPVIPKNDNHPIKNSHFCGLQVIRIKNMVN